MPRRRNIKSSRKGGTGKSGGRSASPSQLLPESSKPELAKGARGDAPAPKVSRKRWKKISRMEKKRRRTLPKIKYKWERKFDKLHSGLRRARKGGL